MKSTRILRTSYFGKTISVAVAVVFLVTSLGIDKAYGLGTGQGFLQPITKDTFRLDYCVDKAHKVIGLLEEAGGLGSATLDNIADREVFVKRDILDTRFQKTPDQIAIEIARGVVVRYYDPAANPAIPEGYVPAPGLGFDATLNAHLARQILLAESIADGALKKEPATTASEPEAITAKLLPDDGISAIIYDTETPVIEDSIPGTRTADYGIWFRDGKDSVPYFSVSPKSDAAQQARYRKGYVIGMLQLGIFSGIRAFLETSRLPNFLKAPLIKLVNYIDRHKTSMMGVAVMPAGFKADALTGLQGGLSYSDMILSNLTNGQMFALAVVGAVLVTVAIVFIYRHFNGTALTKETISSEGERKEISRREMLVNAGKLALGAVAVAVLPGCPPALVPPVNPPVSPEEQTTGWLMVSPTDTKDPHINLTRRGNVITLQTDRFPFRIPSTTVIDLDRREIRYAGPTIPIEHAQVISYGEDVAGFREAMKKYLLEPLSISLDWANAIGEDVTPLSDENEIFINSVFSDLYTLFMEGETLNGDKFETEWMNNPDWTPHDPAIQIERHGNYANEVSMQVDFFPYRRPTSVWIDLSTGFMSVASIGVPTQFATEYYPGRDGEEYLENLNRYLMEPLTKALNWEGLDETTRARLNVVLVRCTEIYNSLAGEPVAAEETTGWIMKSVTDTKDPHINLSRSQNTVTLQTDRFPFRHPSTTEIDLETGIIRYAGPTIPMDYATELRPEDGEAYRQALRTYLLEPLSIAMDWNDFPGGYGELPLSDENYNFLSETHDMLYGVFMEGETLEDDSYAVGRIDGPHYGDVPLVEPALAVTREGNQVTMEVDYSGSHRATTVMIDLSTGFMTVQGLGIPIELAARYYPGRDGETYREQLNKYVLFPLSSAVNWDTSLVSEEVKALFNVLIERVEEFYNQGAIAGEELLSSAVVGATVMGMATPVEPKKSDAEKVEELVAQAEKVVVKQEPLPPAEEHPAVVKDIYDKLPDDEKLSINQIIAVGELIMTAMNIASSESTKGLDTKQAAAVLGYLEANEAVLTKAMFAENKTILRVPVELLRGTEGAFVAAFLGILNTPGTSIYIELFETADPDKALGENVYAEFGMSKKDISEQDRVRENTVSLFAVDGKVDKRQIHEKLQLSNTLKNSMVVPLGLQNDPAGIVRATFLGLSLVRIANNPTDKEFVEETLKSYKALAYVYTERALDLTPEDIMEFVQGGDLNFVVNVIKKLIDSLPMGRLSAKELRAVQELALKLAHAA